MKKSLRILVAVPFFVSAIVAQDFWERTEPYSGTINKMYFGGGDTIYGTLNSGFARSTNNGATWSTPVIVNYVTDMAVSPNGYIFLSENQQKMSRSTNKGASWTIKGTGINEPSCNTVMATSSGTVLAGTAKGIYRSTDNGDNWTKVAGSIELTGDSSITAMATYDGNTLYAFTRTMIANPERGYAFRSTNDGVTWTKGTNSLDTVAIYKAIVASNGTILVRTGNGLRSSTDGGNTWGALGFYNEYIWDVATGPSGEVYTTISGTNPSLLYKTTNNGANWTTINLPFNNKANISVGKSGEIFIGQDQMYRSTDGGTTWKGLPLSYPNVTLMQESAKHELFFTAGGIAYQGLYRSTDFGQSWEPMNPGVVGIPIVGFHADTIYVGDNYYTGTVYRSTDNGETFNSIPNNINLGGYVNALFGTSFNSLLAATSTGIYRSVNPTKYWEKVSSSNSIGSIKQGSDGTLYAVREWYGDGVYRSMDSGSTWQQKITGMSPTAVKNLVIAPNGDLILGTEDGIYRSIDKADNWVRIDTQKVVKPYGIYVAVNRDGKIFMGGAKNGVNSESYQSTDNGATWVYNNNMTTVDNQAGMRGLFAASDGHLFAATTVGLFRSKEVTTEVSRMDGNLPMKFSLGQNYPNPFNPTTVISFQLSVISDVRLIVYDILGKEIETLVNENLTAGMYEVKFNASKLSSGIYFYQLRTGSFVETKKMLMVK